MLSSSSVFSRTDTATDSERFYNSVLDLFKDPEEKEEVNDLFTWWNRYILIHRFFAGVTTKASIHIRQIFPSYSSVQHPVCKNSALARIKKKQAELKSAALIAEES